MSRVVLISLAFATAFFINACSYKSDYKPDFTPESAYSFGDNETNVSAQWWESFDDKDLNGFIETALKDSLDLKAAFQRIKAARATLGESEAALYPEVGVGIDGAQKHLVSGSGSDSESFNAALDGTYQLDLFGKLSALEASSRYDLMIKNEDYKEASLSLVGEICKAWFSLASELQKREVLESEVKTYDDILYIMKLRFASGELEASDIFRQQEQVESLKSQIISSDIKIDTYQRTLLLLAGQNPSGIFPYKPVLSEAPAIPSAGVPSSLLENRPDVKAAFLGLYSKDSLVAYRSRDFFPTLNIGASLLTTSTSWPALFADWLSNIFGQASLVLFDGGAKMSALERAEANLQETEYLYVKSVLNAVKEVEDSYQKNVRQKSLIISQQKQLDLSQKSYERLLERYLGGDSQFIDVLQTQSSFLTNEIDLISEKAKLLEYRVDLMQSVGSTLTPENLISEAEQ